MMNANTMKNRIEELKGLKAMADELQEEIKGYEEEIKAYMKENNLDEARIGDYKIRYKAVTSSRLDSKALKNELPEIAERFSKVNQYMRLYVS